MWFSFLISGTHFYMFIGSNSIDKNVKIIGSDVVTEVQISTLSLICE